MGCHGVMAIELQLCGLTKKTTYMRETYTAPGYLGPPQYTGTLCISGLPTPLQRVCSFPEVSFIIEEL